MELGRRRCAPGRAGLLQAISAAGGISGAGSSCARLDDGYEPDRGGRQYQEADRRRRVPAVRLRRHADVQCVEADHSPRRARSVRRPVHRCRIAAQPAEPLHIQHPRQLFRRDRQDRRADDRADARPRSPFSTRTTITARPVLPAVAARDGQAQPEDRRDRAPSNATPIDVAAAVKSICKVEPQAIIADLGVQVLRRVHQGDAGGRLQPAVHERMRSSAARRWPHGDRRRRTGVGISQVVPFPWNFSAPVVRNTSSCSGLDQEAGVFVHQPRRIHRRQDAGRRPAPHRRRPDARAIHQLRWKRCATSTSAATGSRSRRPATTDRNSSELTVIREGRAVPPLRPGP